MNEEAELRALYKEAKAAGRTDIQEKVISRLEQLQAAPQPVQAPMPAQPTVQQAEQGFFESVEDYKNQRLGNITRYMVQGKLGDRNPAQVALGIASEMIKTGYDGVSKIVGGFVSDVTPDAIEEGFKEWLGQEFQANMNTPHGRLVVDKVMDYQNWAKENPEKAETIENSLTVGGAAFGARQLMKKPPAFNEKYAELMVPKQTPTVKKKLAERMVKPVIGKAKLKYNSREIAGAKLLESTPGVKPGQNVYRNIQAIKKAAEKQYGAMNKALRKADIKFNKDEVQTSMRKNLKVLFDNSKHYAKDRATMPNKPPKDIRDVKSSAMGIIEANNQNLSGLLKSRQELDDLYKAAKTLDQWGTATENAKSRAFREVRDTINDIIIQKAKAKGIDVDKTFRNYSLYMDAKDALKSKVVGDKSGMLKKTAQSAVSLFK